MIHKCADAKNGCLNKDAFRKPGYTSMTTQEISFDDRGYPIYQKKTKADFNVVHRNREIIIKYRNDDGLGWTH